MTAPRLVVHVPHASVVVPDDITPELARTAEGLEHELLVMTDRHTDALLALPPDVATTVTFPVSRRVVDPERFVDDADEPMATKGMGAIYERTAAGELLRRRCTPEERRRLLARFYEPHHAALSAAVQAALDAHSTCLLLDAHSFPSRPLPYEEDQREDRPDICIGTDPRHTPAELKVAAARVRGGRIGASRSTDPSPGHSSRCRSTGEIFGCVR